MTAKDPKPKRTEDHKFPIFEAFNAECVIENPGEIVEDVDTTSDSDAPAP